MELSIVSGTYNRLQHLKDMVETGRKSIGDYYGLDYEFVIVDGNSSDGTQAWCESQPDIHLIRHPQLLGAVKAFNDGAHAAKGKYVVLANDDIIFVDNTLLTAYMFMEDNPQCGIGCFYQDRNGRDWHVEVMPVILDGQQATAPYGQVCIVPKFIGEQVGWWGTYLHTYGGDNELSANVYELGYQISPIQGTKIHDKEVADDLRKNNNIDGHSDPKSVKGHHPDSWAWGRNWRKPGTGLVGPIIETEPQISNPNSRKYRIFYAPIYEQGWAVQKEQKKGLREALARVGIVDEFDYVGIAAQYGKGEMINRFVERAKKLLPDIVLTQLHNGELIGPSDLVIIKSSLPKVKFINWNGDYWPDNLLSEEGYKLAASFDLQTTVNLDAVEAYEKRGINARYWQIGWEPDGINCEPTQFYDLVFLANGYSKERHKLGGHLRAIAQSLKLKFGLFGQGWPDGWISGQNLYDFRAACKIYRGAKFSIGDSQWPESGFVSNRVMQALAAGGAALAHQWFRGMGDLGLIDGETLIVWKDVNELKEKISHYLNHENDRQRIALAGEQLALERHSFDNRVNELLGFLDFEKEELLDGGFWRW